MASSAHGGKPCKKRPDPFLFQITKRWLVWVKEIVGGKSSLKVFLDMNFVDYI